MFKYFEMYFGPNELLLIVGQVVTFGIRANHQPEVCDESRLRLGLDDRASEISLTSPDDLGLCMLIGLTRTSGLNRRSL